MSGQGLKPVEGDRGEMQQTNISTSKVLPYRTDDVVMYDIFHYSDVLSRQGVFVHQSVHCRENISGRRWSERPHKRCLQSDKT
jgi:hypothetical protein